MEITDWKKYHISILARGIANVKCEYYRDSINKVTEKHQSCLKLKKVVYFEDQWYVIFVNELLYQDTIKLLICHIPNLRPKLGYKKLYGSHVTWKEKNKLLLKIPI